VDTYKFSNISPTLAEELSRYIRLLAKAGKNLFKEHLYKPLVYAGWERQMKYNDTKFIMARVDEARSDISKLNTIGPLCKRLISQSLLESSESLGNSSIFFLNRIGSISTLAKSEEGTEFVSIIKQPLSAFNSINQVKKEKFFEDKLEAISNKELTDALNPVELGKSEVKVRIQKEALALFNQISVFSKKDDIYRCRKLIANYLIHYAEQEDNNRDEVEQVIQALENRSPGFTLELNDFIAIQLYYSIFSGISEGDLKKAIQGIRKYAFTFQGNHEIKYFMEIDELEGKLQAVITKKDLWKQLRKESI
jgi:hypothetical protein